MPTILSRPTFYTVIVPVRGLATDWATFPGRLALLQTQAFRVKLVVDPYLTFSACYFAFLSHFLVQDDHYLIDDPKSCLVFFFLMEHC